MSSECPTDPAEALGWHWRRIEDAAFREHARGFEARALFAVAVGLLCARLVFGAYDVPLAHAADMAWLRGVALYALARWAERQKREHARELMKIQRALAEVSRERD